MNETLEQAPVSPIRYNGFTCPKCSSHYFGSFRIHPSMKGQNYPAGTFVGHCNGQRYDAAAQVVHACDFKWNRDDPEMEDKVMYSWSQEEWMASYVPMALR